MMSKLRLEWATHESARYACENWHYSKKIPNSKLVKIGVWEDKDFKGVVIYGVGACPMLVKQYGLKPEQGCELVRIALRDHDHFVSEIISKSIKMLKESNPKLDLIVSYADMDQDHQGKIYQATNWIYTGSIGENKKSAYLIDGKKVHRKTVGDRLNSRNLVCNINNIKKIYETDYVEDFISKGKHKYLMPLNKKMRKKINLLRVEYPSADIVK